MRMSDNLLKGRLNEVGLVDEALFEVGQTVISQLESLLSRQLGVSCKVELFKEWSQVVYWLLTLCSQLLLL